MMRRTEQYCGQNIVELVIILGLVAVVGITALMLLGGNVKSIFTGASEKTAEYKPFEWKAKPASTNTSTVLNVYDDAIAAEPGELGGTPENPVKQCNDDSCSIDFGTISLSGIPKDFNKVIEASGASGETSVISSLLDQIAVQLAEKNTPETLAQSEAIKKLAVTGHNIAYVEQIAETLFNQCNGNEACLDKLADPDASILQQYSDFKGFDNTYTTIDTNWSVTDLAWNISLAQFRQNSESDIANSAQKESMTAAVYLEEYNKLMKDPNLDPSVKGIIEELTNSLSTTVEDFRYAYISEVSNVQTHWDPLTGEFVPGDYPGEPYSFDDYKATKLTNLESALLCAASKHSDTGTKCK
jgi:Flp pilus assembly pilin Flp